VKWELPSFSEDWQIHATGVASCLVLTLVAYVVGFRPLINGRYARADQQTQLNGQRQIASQRAGQLHELENTFDQTQGNLDQLSVKLQPVGLMNQRLVGLTDLAADNGLHVYKIQPDSVQRGDRFDKVPILISGQGTYQTCTAYIGQLRQDFPDVVVVSFSLSGRPADPSQQATFQLQLSWHAVPRNFAYHQGVGD